MLPQIIPVLTLDGRFIGNIVNELPGRVPLSSGQRGAGVAPARTAVLSPVTAGERREGGSSSPSNPSGAFDHTFHDTRDTHVGQ